METSAVLTGTPHRCLCVADIQAMVFKSLTRQDCVHLARTCSSFYDQAMNVVWADVTSLIPLVRCMSPDIVVESEFEQMQSWPGMRLYSNTIDFRREPMDSDWHSFRKHAHRIRKFEAVHSFTRRYPRNINGPQHDRRSCSSALTGSASEVTARFIDQQFSVGSACLFPKLTTLEIHSTKDDQLPAYLPYLCGDTLQTFTVNLGYTSVPPHTPAGIYCTFWELLSVMRTRWPRLSSVEIGSINGRPCQDDANLDQIGAWLGDLLQLQSMDVYADCHPYLVKAISKLPVLQTLNLTGDWDAISTPSSMLSLLPSPSNSHFRSLKELSLVTYQPGYALPLLHALSDSRTLTKLALLLRTNDMHTSPPFSHAPMVLEAISHLPAVDSLDITFAHSYSHTGPLPDTPTFHTQLFAQLFKLRRLRHLTLEGFFHISVTDQDLQDAANAWPDLENIALLFIDADQFPPHFMVENVVLISLIGVQALYNGCPHLKMIDLPVNDVVPIKDWELDLPPSVPRDPTAAVERMSLRYHPIQGDYEEDSEEYMPLVIRILFPQLKELELTHYDEQDAWPPGADNGEWEKQVQTWWKVYRDVSLEAVKAELEVVWEAFCG